MYTPIKSFSLPIIFILCSISFASPLNLQSASKSTFLKQYDRVAKDFRTKNSSDYASMLAPSYKLFIGTRTQDKSATVKDFAKQVQSMTLISWNRQISKLVLTGSTATVTVNGHFVGKFAQHSSFDLHASNVDTWIKSKGSWVLLSTKVTGMKALVNGKPAGSM